MASAAGDTQRLTRVLMAQLKHFRTAPHPNLLLVVDEKDIRQWYFLAGGLDAPFRCGEYIFKLTASDNFPLEPPSFEFCTPNGVYTPGGAICISIGEFHAHQAPGRQGSYGWRPSLGMAGFATQVVNGLICHEALEHGIRIEKTGPAVKALHAKSSRDHNRRRYPQLNDAFEKILADSPELECVRAIAAARQAPVSAPVSAPPVSAPATAPPVLAPVSAPPVSPPVSAPATLTLTDEEIDDLLG